MGNSLSRICSHEVSGLQVLSFPRPISDRSLRIPTPHFVLNPHTFGHTGHIVAAFLLVFGFVFQSPPNVRMIFCSCVHVLCRQLLSCLLTE